MADVDIPHLAWPFRMATGTHRLAQVEQDEIEDVQQNVRSYLATVRGERPLSPDFGLEDPTFTSALDGHALAAEIMDAEERAEVTVNVAGPDATGHMAVDVHVEVAE